MNYIKCIFFVRIENEFWWFDVIFCHYKDVVTNQPGRENEASSPTIVNPIPSESGATSSAPPPSYSEVIQEKSSQELEKPNETTALNAGEKVGYTPGIAI